jgi:hypothetical protein
MEGWRASWARSLVAFTYALGVEDRGLVPDGILLDLSGSHGYSSISYRHRLHRIESVCFKCSVGRYKMQRDPTCPFRPHMQCAQLYLHDIEAPTAQCRVQRTRDPGPHRLWDSCLRRDRVRISGNVTSLMPAPKLNGIPFFIPRPLS